MILKNPFSDYGGIVTESRFVGRKDEIQAIKNRLLGVSYGNLAIIGLPRIGKSSLAWNAVYKNKENLISNKIISVWVSFGEYESIYDAFADIIFDIGETLVELKELSLSLNEINDKIIKSESNLEKRRFIKRYFKHLRSHEFRVIIIFDEFDNASNILKVQEFQFLRELSYNIETKLGLLTISRKTIQELEPDNGTLSNFYQIFSELRLKMFSEDDMLSYWSRVKDYGIILKQNYVDLVINYSGSHPYLLDVLNHEVFNQISQTEDNLEDKFNLMLSDLRLKLFNEYEAILNLVKNEHLDSKLMQVIIGPVYDISMRDVEKLLKYNIIDISLNDSYSSFSTYFNDYLLIKSRELDVWPLWSEVENEVRYIISTYLIETFGENWVDEYIKKYKQKKADDFINEKIEIQRRNKAAFGDKASDNLIDYTYPLE
jgi:hypothetical protein